jgi:hypothetical protein
LRLKQLRARRVRVEARLRAQDARRERKDDTRRKILVGAVVLTKVQHGVVARSELDTWLDAVLPRADDRALFGFEGEKQGRGSG